MAAVTRGSTLGGEDERFYEEACLPAHCNFRRAHDPPPPATQPGVEIRRGGGAGKIPY